MEIIFCVYTIIFWIYFYFSMTAPHKWSKTRLRSIQKQHLYWRTLLGNTYPSRETKNHIFYNGTFWLERFENKYKTLLKHNWIYLEVPIILFRAIGLSRGKRWKSKESGKRRNHPSAFTNQWCVLALMERANPINLYFNIFAVVLYYLNLIFEDDIT